MRILFVNHNARDIGTYFRCFDIARSLVRLGHSVTLVCAAKDPSSAVVREMRDGVQCIYLPRLAWDATWKRCWDNFLRGVKTIPLCTSEYDVIHCFAVAQFATAIPALWVHWFRRRSTLFIDWDDWWGDGGIALDWGEPIHTVMTWLEQRVVRVGVAVTVVSDALRERALHLGIPDSNIHKIINGGRPERIIERPSAVAKQQLGLPAQRRIVLFEGGSLIPRKAIELLLGAFTVVSAAMEDVDLYFLGKSIPETTALIEQYGLAQRAFLTGFVSEDDFVTYLEAADVLAFPMENCKMEIGRWPCRFGDYLAAGRPIVAHDVGEVGSCIRTHRCGLLASPDDVQMFARHILTFLKQPEFAVLCARRARQLAEANDWMKVARDLEGVYKRYVA